MNKLKINLLLILLLGTISLFSCRPEVPFPRPKGYVRIDFPEDRTYLSFEETSFPYSFKYSNKAIISQDTQLVIDTENPYWLNVDYPEYNATIFLSYKEINQNNTLHQLIDESFRLSYKHDIKADFIHSPDFITENGLIGIYYNVGGNTASNDQFVVSDTLRHFMRGALYFNVTPNQDSIRPVLNYLRKDLEIMIESIKFY